MYTYRIEKTILTGRYQVWRIRVDETNILDFGPHRQCLASCTSEEAAQAALRLLSL